MHSTRMFYINLKVPWELYKELQLCPNMILTRSHSSGSLRLIPDTTSSQTLDISNANESVSLEQGAFAPISNTCVPQPLQPDYSNSALLSRLQNRNSAISNTVNAVSTNATKPFYITYSALSNGKTIIPLVNNISPSVIYLPPVPDNTKSVLSDRGTSQTNQVVEQSTTLTTKTVLGDCRDSNVNHAVTSDVKISNKSDTTGFLPVAELVLSNSKELRDDKVVISNEELNKSDKSFLPTTESVLSDSKALCDDKVVISNAEVNKSDKSFLPPAETVFSDSKSLHEDKVVISNAEVNKSDKSSLPTTEPVSSDSKESNDKQVVISNEETNNESDTGLFPTAESVLNDSGRSYIKEIGTSDEHLNKNPPTSLGNSIMTNSPTTLEQESFCIGTLEKAENLKLSPGLGCNPNNSIISSKSTANLMPGKLIIVNGLPRKEKIRYPRECDKCLKKYSHKSSFSTHKKRCGGVEQEESESKKVRRPIPLTFEQACIDWKIKYPDTIRNSLRVPQNSLRMPKIKIPTPINFKDKKWVHFSSGKAAFYVKSASLKK